MSVEKAASSGTDASKFGVRRAMMDIPNNNPMVVTTMGVWMVLILDTPRMLTVVMSTSADMESVIMVISMSKNVVMKMK